MSMRPLEPALEWASRPNLPTIFGNVCCPNGKTSGGILYDPSSSRARRSSHCPRRQQSTGCHKEVPLQSQCNPGAVSRDRMAHFKARLQWQGSVTSNTKVSRHPLESRPTMSPSPAMHWVGPMPIEQCGSVPPTPPLRRCRLARTCRHLQCIEKEMGLGSTTSTVA